MEQPDGNDAGGNSGKAIVDLTSPVVIYIRDSASAVGETTVSGTGDSPSAGGETTVSEDSDDDDDDDDHPIRPETEMRIRMNAKLARLRIQKCIVKTKNKVQTFTLVGEESVSFSFCPPLCPGIIANTIFILHSFRTKMASGQMPIEHEDFFNETRGAIAKQEERDNGESKPLSDRGLRYKGKGNVSPTTSSLGAAASASCLISDSPTSSCPSFTLPSISSSSSSPPAATHELASARLRSGLDKSEQAVALAEADLAAQRLAKADLLSRAKAQAEQPLILPVVVPEPVAEPAPEQAGAEAAAAAAAESRLIGSLQAHSARLAELAAALTVAVQGEAQARHRHTALLAATAALRAELAAQVSAEASAVEEAELARLGQAQERARKATEAARVREDRARAEAARAAAKLAEKAAAQAAATSAFEERKEALLKRKREREEEQEGEAEGEEGKKKKEGKEEEGIVICHPL